MTLEQFDLGKLSSLRTLSVCLFEEPMAAKGDTCRASGLEPMLALSERGQYWMEKKNENMTASRYGWGESSCRYEGQKARGFWKDPD